MFVIGNEKFTDAEFDEAFIQISNINPRLAVAVVEAGIYEETDTEGKQEGCSL